MSCSAREDAQPRGSSGKAQSVRRYRNQALPACRRSASRSLATRGAAARRWAAVPLGARHGLAAPYPPGASTGACLARYRGAWALTVRMRRGGEEIKPVRSSTYEETQETASGKRRRSVDAGAPPADLRRPDELVAVARPVGGNADAVSEPGATAMRLGRPPGIGLSRESLFALFRQRRSVNF